MPRLGGASDFWARKHKATGPKKISKINPANVEKEKAKARTFSNNEPRPCVYAQNLKERPRVAGQPPLVGLVHNNPPFTQILPSGLASYRVDEDPSQPDVVYRPTVCTPLVAERMALLVASGVQQNVAGAAMGIDLKTLRDWNDWGERDLAAEIDSVYATWWTTMLMAKASCEANWIARVNAGALMDWKAAAYLLERRFGIRWAPKAPTDKLPEGTDTSGKSIEELREMLKLLMSGTLALPANTESASEFGPITIKRKGGPGRPKKVRTEPESNGEPESDTTKA